MSCDGIACCTHPAESERVLNRDGVLYLVCVECNTEREPAPAITVAAIGVPESVAPVIPETVSAPDIESCHLTQKAAAPCGDDVAHKWGGPL